MALSCRSLADPAAFDAVLLALVGSAVRPHVLQTSHWAALKAPVWSARHLLWEESGRPMAAATVLTRRWGRLPLQVLYVPKGPVVPPDPAVWDRVLTDLEQLARAGIFLKIDPDVPADTDFGQALTARLRARGWVESAEQIQFRNTLLSDLRPDEAALLAAMKQKTRYNIRLAMRKGVRVWPADDFETFYALYAETAARDGFIIRPPDYYLAVMRRMQGQGLGQLFLAEVGGDAVAGLFLLCFGPTAWYFYGASADRHREAMPNHLLQWEAMRWAKDRGCTTYDWWGAPDRLDETDPMWGVYRFKEGFGGRFTPWIGAWDFAPRPTLYRLYTELMPRLLDRMRRRHVQPFPRSNAGTV
ncbi:MAG: peptidoglycan bridge formation glycyltransferase FemA/FemB family protein [Anaerolineae bacterium]|nr:peptidoglycan bridge formation glycyltransferase FemA/FemB family protein [Caldilineales bacterium]MDW8267654.1 peptidoglycan bridge formation glycyltransferase FemA/FemB family protein [Anaerolineae bacterium]